MSLSDLLVAKSRENFNRFRLEHLLRKANEGWEDHFLPQPMALPEHSKAERGGHKNRRSLSIAIGTIGSNFPKTMKDLTKTCGSKKGEGSNNRDSGKKNGLMSKFPHFPPCPLLCVKTPRPCPPQRAVGFP